MLGAAVADGASAHAVNVSPVRQCLLHAHGECKGVVRVLLVLNMHEAV